MVPLHTFTTTSSNNSALSTCTLVILAMGVLVLSVGEVLPSLGGGMVGKGLSIGDFSTVRVVSWS